MQFIQAVVRIILNVGLDAIYLRQEPRVEQVESIRRIVYELGATILLAKTGFGKSIVFQAVSILRPDKITILIVSLSMLAEEQRKTIARFPNAKPIVIDQSIVKVNDCISKPIDLF
jgi:superfamily II DNA helicase RecQ